MKPGLPPLDLLIRGALLATDSGVYEADTGVRAGRIALIAGPGEARALVGEATRIIDARGLVALPGAIDSHIHPEGQWGSVSISGDFATATGAALIGGTTTVISFCEPVPGETAIECITSRKKQAAKAVADYAFHFAFTEDYGPQLQCLDRIVEEGITSFKAFTCYGGLTLDRGELLEVMTAVRGAGVLMIHAEAVDVLEAAARRLVAAGQVSPYHHAVSRPNLAEHLAVRDAILLQKEARAGICIAHASTRQAVEEAREAQRQAGGVYVETCPHYLHFTDEVMRKDAGALFVMSPPLRSGADIEALWQGISDGTVTIISTDHCPYPKAAKLMPKEFPAIPNGVGGIQTRFTFMYSEGCVKRGLALERLVAVASSNPAKVFGLYPMKGCLEPGSDADIVLLDPKQTWTFTARDLVSGEDHSIYEGMDFTGRVRFTISRGEVVVDEGVLTAASGRGRFLPRKRRPV